MNTDNKIIISILVCVFICFYYFNIIGVLILYGIYIAVMGNVCYEENMMGNEEEESDEEYELD